MLFFWPQDECGLCAADVCEIGAELDRRAHPMQRGDKGRQSSPGEITKQPKCDKCVAVFFELAQGYPWNVDL